MTDLLKTEHLRKSFGGVKAVADISMSVPEKSIFAVIGPNGAGKSTLMNLLSGTYQPDTGELTFAGNRLTGMPSHRRVKLGLARTFQKIRLFKQLSLLDNVLAGFHIHHDVPAWQYFFPRAAFWRDWRRCREEGLALLDFVGLADRASQRAGSLAYGQQRMLEIARAMATRPKLFILDEPAAGLNATEVAFLLQRLQDIRARGITLVVVEHNMDLVMNVADRVFVMEQGQYLFDGTPREVQDNPKVIAAYLGGELA
jgi:branched-chain amino acid transport system ATP-binding protein